MEILLGTPVISPIWVFNMKHSILHLNLIDLIQLKHYLILLWPVFLIFQHFSIQNLDLSILFQFFIPLYLISFGLIFLFTKNLSFLEKLAFEKTIKLLNSSFLTLLWFIILFFAFYFDFQYMGFNIVDFDIL